MIQRSNIAIDPEKAKDFAAFVEQNAKDKSFWEDIKKVASTEFDKEELDRLYNAEEKEG